MDVHDFVREWWRTHIEEPGGWADIDVEECVTAAIAQDREEREKCLFHGDRNEYCGKCIDTASSDPLAAKLEALAEKAGIPKYNQYWKAWAEGDQMTGPYFHVRAGHVYRNPNTPLAAVDAELKEVDG